MNPLTLIFVASCAVLPITLAIDFDTNQGPVLQKYFSLNLDKDHNGAATSVSEVDGLYTSLITPRVDGGIQIPENKAIGTFVPRPALAGHIRYLLHVLQKDEWQEFTSPEYVNLFKTGAAGNKVNDVEFRGFHLHQNFIFGDDDANGAIDRKEFGDMLTQLGVPQQIVTAAIERNGTSLFDKLDASVVPDDKILIGEFIIFVATYDHGSGVDATKNFLYALTGYYV